MSPNTPAAKASYISDRVSHKSSSNANSKSLEENAEEVSRLFASTITSLSADVSALQHLTTWKDILQNNDTDNNSTTPNNNVADERREEFLESLCDLDDVVTAVEKKVGVLRQIVSEEQKALESLNMLRLDSNEQNQNLKQLVEQCRQIKITAAATTAAEDQDLRKNSSREGDENARIVATSKTHNNSNDKEKRRFPSAQQQQQRPKETVALGVNTSRNSTDSNNDNNSNTHTHADGLRCFLDPITQNELEGVPRTTKGRVQVAVLNEALENIESCFHKKAVREQRKHQQLVEARMASLSHYEAGNDEMDDEEIIRNMKVTEQELRKSCSFFAAGEGTARTVIAVLKELKRLRQVPSKKKGLFLYALCFD